MSSIRVLTQHQGGRGAHGNGRGGGGSNPTLENIDRALQSLQRLNDTRVGGVVTLVGRGTAHSSAARRQGHIEAMANTAALGDLQSNLQDLCTTLCISGESYLRSLDVPQHVRLLMRCFRADGVGHDVMVLSLRAICLIAEGSPKGVSTIVDGGGVKELLSIALNDLPLLLSSDQLTEEVLKCLQACAIDAHRQMLREDGLSILLRLANSLSDNITKHLAYTCVETLFSVATPDDWENLDMPLSILLSTLDDRLDYLKKATNDRHRMRRPETKQEAAQLRSIIASIRREESLVVRLASCFVRIVDRVCQGPDMCTTVFSSKFGERIVPLALTLFSFSENSDVTVHNGARGEPGRSSGNSANSSSSSIRMRAAAISLLSSMFVASPRDTLRRLSQHGAWRWLRALAVALVSSSSKGNSMRAMVYGNVTEDQLELLADLNRVGGQLGGSDVTGAQQQIPSPMAAAGLGNGSASSNAAVAAANRSLLGMIRRPTEPLVVEEFSAVALMELLLFLTPTASSVFVGGETEASVDSRSLLTPIHMWQWEDEFHNKYDYEEHVSTALEIEYKTQQISRVFRSVDITAGGRSVSASFEKMRHYTLGGIPLRPLFRQPFVSHFYHTKTPFFVSCACYEAGLKEGAPAAFYRSALDRAAADAFPQLIVDNGGDRLNRRRSTGRTLGAASSQTRGADRGDDRGGAGGAGGSPADRRKKNTTTKSNKSSNSKSTKGNFLSRLLSGCCSRAGRDVSPERGESTSPAARNRRGDPNRSPLTGAADATDAADSLSGEEARSEKYFDSECRAYLDKNPSDALMIATSLISLATTVSRRVVNPALLRHCAILMLRGLTLMRNAKQTLRLSQITASPSTGVGSNNNNNKTAIDHANSWSLTENANAAVLSSSPNAATALQQGDGRRPTLALPSSPLSTTHTKAGRGEKTGNNVTTATSTLITVVNPIHTTNSNNGGGGEDALTSPASPLSAHDFIMANKAGIVKAINVLLLCSDLEHLERLCASSEGLDENADHTHAPRWQVTMGGYGEKPLGSVFSLQGEMLLAAVESIHLLVELYPPSAEDLWREGVYRAISGGVKTLATVADSSCCPQHQSSQCLLSEAHRRLSHCVRLLEQVSSPLRHTHGSSTQLTLLVNQGGGGGGRQTPSISAGPTATAAQATSAHVSKLTPRNSLLGFGFGFAHSSTSSFDEPMSPLPPPHSPDKQDKKCPVALYHALAILQTLKRSGSQSVGDSLANSIGDADKGDFCQLCTAASELRKGDMTSVSEGQEQQSFSIGSLRGALGGGRKLTNQQGQTLKELLSSPAGATYRAALEDLTLRLVTYIGDQVGVAGSSTSDVVGITRNHKTVTLPMSRVMACMQQRLALPIAFRLVPAHPRSEGERPVPHWVSVRGREYECVPSHGGIVSINLQAFLFTTVGAVADDLAAKYSEVMANLGWDCSCSSSSAASGGEGELCRNCQQLASAVETSDRDNDSESSASRERNSFVHPSTATATGRSTLPDMGAVHGDSEEGVQRRLTFHHPTDLTQATAAAGQESAVVLPNQVHDHEDEGEARRDATRGGRHQAPRANDQRQVPPPSARPLPLRAQKPIPSERVILLVNGYPLVDRFRRLGDVIMSFGNNAAAFRSMLDPSGTDAEARAALAKALGVWGTQHTLQFAFLKEPLGPEAMPKMGRSGCTCGTCARDTAPYSSRKHALSVDAGESSTCSGGETDDSIASIDDPLMRVAVARYKESICSPWHIYADQRRRHGHCVLDDILGLIEALVEVFVAPLARELLLDASRKIYSSVVHSIRYQSLSFAAPAFSALCHPILTSHHVGDSVAEYALWNYPSLFPLALRVAVFRQIIAAKRSIMPKGNMAARNVVGGEWLGLLNGVSGGGGGAAGAATRDKIKAKVKRENILAEGKRVFEALAMCPLTLDVEFENEPGSGLGPTCEFFCLVAGEFLKKSTGMWQSLVAPNSADDGDEGSDTTSGTDYIMGRLFPSYSMTADALDLFQLLGRVIGRALQDGREIRVPLHTVFVSRILGHGHADTRRSSSTRGNSSSECLSDTLVEIDPQLEKSLAQLEEMSAEELETLDLPYTFPGLDLELIQNGNNVTVTVSTVRSFCNAVRHHACVTSLEAPTRRILEGIADSIVPGHLRLFAAHELNFLIGGPEGKLWESAEDVVRIIRCDHGYTMQSPAVMFFVNTIASFSAAEQRLFLKFLSGTDCLPIGGLNPPITIVRKGLTADATPYRRRKKNANGYSVSPSVGPSEPSPNGHLTPPAMLLVPTVLAGASPRTPTNAFLSVTNNDMNQNGTSEGSFSAAVEQSVPAGPLEIPENNHDPSQMLVSADGDRLGVDNTLLTEGGSPSFAANPLVGDEAIVLSTQEQVDECLPTVNTCFHYLKLPDYSSEEVCRERLLCAIMEGQGVFLLS